jgi:hypothetical protein
LSRCSGLLSDNEYDYNTPTNALQPPPEEKEEIPMEEYMPPGLLEEEEYMPPGLSEEEAIQLAIVRNKLIAEWEGVITPKCMGSL